MQQNTKVLEHLQYKRFRCLLLNKSKLLINKKNPRFSAEIEKTMKKRRVSLILTQHVRVAKVRKCEASRLGFNRAKLLKGENASRKSSQKQSPFS